MTKQEAKELSIEVWQYLADNPDIDDKRNLPYWLWNKIENILTKCPLCEVSGPNCEGCPLDINGSKCSSEDSIYEIWYRASFHDVATRKQAAQEILHIIKAWEPEDEE